MNFVKQKIRIFKFIDRQIDLMAILLAMYSSLLLARILLYDEIELSFIITPETFIRSTIIVSLYLIFLTIYEHNVQYRSTSIWSYSKKLLYVTYFSISIFYLLDYIVYNNPFYVINDNFIIQSELDLFFNNPYFVLLFSFVTFFLLITKKIMMKFFLSKIREAGFDPKNIVIVGTNQRSINLVNDFSKHQEYGFIVKGVFSIKNNLEDDKIFLNSTPVVKEIIKEIEVFQDFIIENNIDEVFFTEDPSYIKPFQSIINFLNFTGISYHFSMSTGHSQLQNKTDFKVVADQYYGIPMMSYHSVSANLYKLAVKSLFERIIALILIVFTLPLTILTAFLIKISTRGSIFFKQKRVGLRGRMFYQYKFRSMVVDAESMKKELEYLNEQSGPVFKISNDPRLTKIGRFIRKFSIDELPQLANVLIGNMSLIGPRPPIPDEVKEYKDNHRRRLSMKPGITGLWQVSGRNSINDFDDWVKIDLRYIDNWSFWLDIKIAFKTFFVVLSGTGK